MTNISCPSCLSFVHDSNSLQNLSVRNLVLPADVEDVAETPEMELLDKFLMSSETALVHCYVM